MRKSASATRPRRVRVHELARELGVDSGVILSCLSQLGEYARGAASAIEHPVAECVRASIVAVSGGPRVAPRPRQSETALPPETGPRVELTHSAWFAKAQLQAAHSRKRSGRWTNVEDLSPLARALLPEFWRGRPRVPPDVVDQVNRKSLEWAEFGFTERTASAWCDTRLIPKVAGYLAGREIDPRILDEPIRPRMGLDLTWTEALHRGFLGTVEQVCERMAYAGYHVAPERVLEPLPIADRPTNDERPTVSRKALVSSPFSHAEQPR